MRSIHKYKLTIGKDQTVEIPLPSNEERPILTVQVQGGSIMLWAMVETINEPVPFRVDVVGTGGSANYGRRAFIGTVQMPPFVWHVFAWRKAA